MIIVPAVPASSDPYRSLVVAQMAFDGTLADTSPLAATWSGSGVSIDTTTYKTGSGSLRISGGYLTAPAPVSNYAFGTSDYTVEAWVYLQDTSGYRNVFAHNQFAFWYNGGYINGPGVSAALVANTWKHVAITRSGTTSRMFINGTLSSTGADTTDYSSPSIVRLGASSAANDFWVGCIDDFRITKACRYTASFTPPT